MELPDSTKKLLLQWTELLNKQATGISADPQRYQADIFLGFTSAKIERMSRRRQKTAMKKRPRTVFKGCYPAYVGALETDACGFTTTTVTFESKVEQSQDVTPGG